jgi:alpha-1,2-mannosyltransferase
MMTLARRPLLAGVLLGLMCYKPQFGLLIPVALAAGGHWRAFFGAAATVVALALASFLAFGPETWLAFLEQLRLQREIFEVARWFRIPTVFGALRVAGIDAALSHALQGASALLAAALLFRVWRGGATVEVKGAALALGMFLATPYAWDYDMVILTFAAAWIATDAQRAGFLPWEKIAWLCVILLPIPLMFLAQAAGLQPAPIFLWLAFLLTVKRAALARQ